MSGLGAETGALLVVTAAARACAIPLKHVAETMRPLRIEPVAGTPRFVRGVSVIRGAPTPVIDLGKLLDRGGPTADFGRFVTLKVGERRVAVGVDGVVGVWRPDTDELVEVPFILRDVDADMIEAIGARDAKLLVVLSAARLLPDEVWATLAATLAPGAPA